MHDEENIPPWYKQFWPWFLIGILVFAVVIGLGLLFISLANQDSMVRDNYYKEGRAINMHLGRDTMAREMGLSAEFAVDELTGEISLTMHGDLELPRTLQLDVISPSHAERDVTVLLTQLRDNQYVGQLDRPVSGRHFIDLSDPALSGEAGWRLTDEITLEPGEQYRVTFR